MNPDKFQEAIWLKNRTPEVIEYNQLYREKHSEFEQFYMPERFWFKIYPELQIIHWAVIRKHKSKKVAIYFINIDGRAFDRILSENEKDAEKLLKKSKFLLNTKNKVTYLPIQPIFVSIIKSKKKALYSKGGWLNYKKCKYIKNNRKQNYSERLLLLIYELKEQNPQKFKILAGILIFLYVAICLFIGFKFR